MIQIGLLGKSGRMGQWVTQLIQADYGSQAVLATGAGSADLESLSSALLSADVVIDFSQPEAVVKFIGTAKSRLANQKKLPAFVIGSTGWSAEQLLVLENLAQSTLVLRSSNFSLGVLALQQILKTSGLALQRLGYSPVIIETHHIHKKDAPSGTALMLKSALDDGFTETPIHSIRAGEVIGDHEVSFFGPADRISFSHHAQDRSLFARGAIDVALWLAKKRGSATSGLFSMETFYSETLHV